MNMRTVLLPAMMMTMMVIAMYGQGSIGIFDKSLDIGKPEKKGETTYLPLESSYYLKGSGYNIWFNRDEYQYAFKEIAGDFILTANFKLMGKGVNPHRKIGWMIRSTEDADAAHVTATVHGDGLTVMQWRALRGAYMRDPEDEIFSPKSDVETLQLERSGDQYIMSIANPGEPLQEIGRTKEPKLGDQVLVGIFICSHDSTKVEEGIAWNVRIIKTIRDQDPLDEMKLGSKLEVMSINDGIRKIVYEDTATIKAPTWSRDSKRILFNKAGKIYSIQREGSLPKGIKTGKKDLLITNHLISPDGRSIGVSTSPDTTSKNAGIYYFPLDGGEPKSILEIEQANIHGWSPDGREVVYSAQIPGKSTFLNVFKKTLSGSKSTQLTFHTRGHADGAEYSPDGRYIYYNSNVSGTMQIYRMKADGKDQEQLTFGSGNNWFPHPSPDNKWLAFLTYPYQVESSERPYCKNVELRIMPISGGAPKVVAHLYGGEGSFNSPAWSPDGKYLAFVSNSLPLENK